MAHFMYRLEEATQRTAEVTDRPNLYLHRNPSRRARHLAACLQRNISETQHTFVTFDILHSAHLPHIRYILHSAHLPHTRHILLSAHLPPIPVAVAVAGAPQPRKPTTSKVPSSNTMTTDAVQLRLPPSRLLSRDSHGQTSLIPPSLMAHGDQVTR
jgi:hypothetical protein